MSHTDIHGSKHASGQEDAMKVSDFAAADKDVAMGGYKLTGVGAPSADTDVATKGYTDSVAEGLDVKGSVKVTTTESITLSGEQTIDEIGVVAGDRVLVKDQGTGSQNGIYVAAVGAWARAADMPAASGAAGAFCFVEQGTLGADNGYACTNQTGSDVVGTDALVFVQFSGAGQIIAGNGLTKIGNTLNAVGGNGIAVAADSIAIDLATNPGLQFSTAKLDLKLDGTTLQKDGDGVSVKGVPATFEINGNACGANVTAANLDELTGSGECDIHIHDGRYFTESEFIASSAGAGDAGKPIKLDAGGLIDASMIDDSDISHDNLGSQRTSGAYNLHMKENKTLAGATPADADVATWADGERGIGIGTDETVWLLYKKGTGVKSVQLT